MTPEIILPLQSYFSVESWIASLKLMNFRIPLIAAAVAFIILTGACNKDSDKGLNRLWQNMNARNNAYYHGKLRLDRVVRKLQTGFKDNFNEVLPVFAYGDENTLKAQANEVDEVIKKCSKIITARPKSKWVDDAYLLMGKAYFFKGDFYAAIETFQYLENRYKGTPIVSEARIWILKSYDFLGRYGDAEAFYSEMKSSDKTPREMMPFFNAVTTDLYIREKKYGAALEYMRLAMPYARTKPAKARFNFILGQLYALNQKPDSAIMAFSMVNKYDPPYEMEFSAQMNIIALFDPKDPSQIKRARRNLQNMLRDDKHEDNFDKIHFVLGNLALLEKNTDEAIRQYTQALQVSRSQPAQKAMVYLALAELYFNQPVYRLAQAYYDSAALVIPKEAPRYEEIKFRQETLNDLIRNITIVQREDSLQLLAKMPPAELDKRIDEIIRQEKEAERQKKLKAEEDKFKQTLPGGGQPLPGGPALAGGGGAEGFYFYNPVMMTQGKTEFQRKWGNRTLTDDWRYGSKEKSASTEDETEGAQAGGKETKPAKREVDDEEKLKGIPEEKRRFYRDLPLTDEDLKESDEKIALALMNIGVIYYERLKDYPEAIRAFSTFVTRFQRHELEPKAIFYLVKCYRETGNKEDENRSFENLKRRYPESDYIPILEGKRVTQGAALEEGDAEINRFYEATYALYEKGKYKEARAQIRKADSLFAGNSIEARFALLEAMIIGKTEGKENFIIALEDIIVTYPGTEIAVKASSILDVLKAADAETKMDSAQLAMMNAFRYDRMDIHYAMIYFPSAKQNTNKAKLAAVEFNAKFFAGVTLDIQAVMLDKNTQALVIKEFPNDVKVMDYIKRLEANKKSLDDVPLIGYKFIGISNKNFGELLKNKQLTLYEKFYQQNYKP